MNNSDKKHVLITGALGGIGRATARKFKRHGWRVIGLDLAEKPSSSCYLDGYHQLDLSQESRSLAVRFDQILRSLPRLDSLVHVAGLQVCASVENSDLINDWDRLFSVNLKSVYLLSQKAFPQLKSSGGNIVVVGSIHAFASSEQISMYAISKTALVGLVRNLALEWGRQGVRVNGIAPGAIDTPMLREGLSRQSGKTLEQALEVINRRHLRGKIGSPREMAELICFLATNRRSGFITGQTMIADGGASLILSTEVSPE